MVAARRRYLRISIDRRASAANASRSSVTNFSTPSSCGRHGGDQSGDVASLYRRIGFRSESGLRACFDSRLAIETGQRVRREVLSASATIATR